MRGFRPPFRLLVIKLGGIGDIVQACGALRQLKSCFPIELHWVVDKEYEELLAGLWKKLQLETFAKLVIRTIASRDLFDGVIVAQLKAAYILNRLSASENFDATLLLHRNPRYLPFFANASASGLFFHLRQDATVPEKDQYASLIKSVLVPLGACKSANLISASGSPTATVGIHVGGGSGAKAYYREKTYPHFRGFVDFLLLQGARIKLFGGLTDKAPFESLLNRENVKACFGLDWPELFQEIETCAQFVSIDTGIGHIAAELMVSRSPIGIVTLFGPTDPKQWRPSPVATKSTIIKKNLACSPCYRNDGKFRTCIYSGSEFQKCMKLISPQEVGEALNFRSL